MSLATFLLAPLALMVPSAGAADNAADTAPDPVNARAELSADSEESHATSARSANPPWPYRLLFHAFEGQSANQVRIEQRMTIRITPRAALEPNMLADLPNRAVGPRFTERKVGKCLPVSSISGVQTAGPSRLILYMRDQRIISAELERACRSREFYSGFYLSRSQDGLLCVDRDTLLSRSGTNCKLTRFRQLIESD